MPVKLTVAALSLVATLEGWAVLAADDSKAGPTPNMSEATPTRPPIPTLVPPPTPRQPAQAVQAGSSVNTPAQALAPLPRPVARTRSSR